MNKEIILKDIQKKIKKEWDLEEQKSFLNTCSLLGIKRILDFFTQCAYECNYFTRYEENLYYTSPHILVKIFSHFKEVSHATPFLRNPEKLANKVYADRLGNGDEKSGDGWRYRGMGAIQVTGKNNHNQVLEKFGNMKAPLNELPYAFYSAGVFWLNNNLDDPKLTHEDITRKVSGSYRTTQDRLNILEAVKKDSEIFNILSR